MIPIKPWKKLADPDLNIYIRNFLGGGECASILNFTEDNDERYRCSIRNSKIKNFYCIGKDVSMKWVDDKLIELGYRLLDEKYGSMI